MNDYELKCLEYFWDSDVIFNESALPIKKDGEIRARLRFDPIEIISVTDSTLSKKYIEGVDFRVENNELVFLSSGRTPDFLEDSALLGINMPEEIAHDRDPYGFKCLYTDKPFFILHQLAVTYRFKRGDWTFIPPVYDRDRLAKTRLKLKRGEPVEILLYGDSISTGMNSSKLLGVSPYLPPWYDLVVDKLGHDFKSKVTLTNVSEGGKTAEWAANMLVEKIGDKKADLLIIAFGMNDGTLKLSLDGFIGNIKKIKEWQANRDCEIILVGTITPNVDCGYYDKHRDFARILYRLEDERTTVVDMGALQQFFLERKRYSDMSGNNINHLNDFQARLYATSILYAIY